MGRLYRAIEVISGTKRAYTVGFIDTGADNSVMSKRLADSMGTELKGCIEMVSASGHLIVGRQAEVCMRTLSDDMTADLEIGVTDELFDDEIDENGVEVIIGLDFLEDVNMRIEF
ncbi:MAG TPA: retroviral-like aspartic protease [Methanosarcinales archaeon]|nr:retroviral-like aspartic protease [Methanosarcinales archaeon]